MNNSVSMAPNAWLLLWVFLTVFIIQLLKYQLRCGQGVLRRDANRKYVDVLFAFYLLYCCCEVVLHCGHHLQNHSFMGGIAYNFHLSSIPFAGQHVRLVVNQCCFISGQFHFTEVRLTWSQFVSFKCSLNFFFVCAGCVYENM